MKIIGIIPARMGSKSIINKNIQTVGARTLIEISVSAAELACDSFYISSESDQIEEMCHDNNWKFLRRPNSLAQDDSLDLEYLSYHVQNDLDLRDKDWLFLLRPTSPLRTIDALSRFRNSAQNCSDATSIRSVIEAPITPYKMWQRTSDKYLQQLNLPCPDGITEPYNAPRQNLPKIYWQTGTYDAYRVENICSGFLSGNRILSFDANHQEIDIDDYSDLELARLAYDKDPLLWV